jgi:hypothetical protein
LFENLGARLMLLRPYRCWSCDYRHYGYLFLRKNHGRRAYASTSATLLFQIPKSIPVLPLLLLVPWALASTGSDLMLLGLTLSNPPRETARMLEIPPSAQPRPQALPQARMVSTVILASAPRWQVEPSTSFQDKPEGQPELAPSRPAPAEQVALGTVNSTGEVMLNGARVPQLATIYADDTVGTGPDGNAVIKIQGKGDIEVNLETLIKFPNSPQYLAQLEHGQISFRLIGQVKGFQVRVGNFVVVPDPGSPETIANISRDASGLTRVRAVQGSVGIIELEGPRTTFIRSGQEVSISPDGSIIGGGAPSQPSPVAPMLAKTGGGHTGIILLGVGAAGAAGAAAALASGGGTSSPSVSPFTP